MKSLCRALLVIDILYCLLASVQDGLPGWHMFESVERLDFTLRDRDGAIVDLAARLPKGARLVDESELREVVRFICDDDKSHAPFTFDEPNLHAVIGPDDCRVPHAHR